MINIIPLNKLTLSDANARKTPGTREELQELMASITEHGLQQNLVTIKGSKKDSFEVLAGGRRFEALQEMAKAGTIPEDHPVPCRIETSALEPSEVSLAENTVRHSMHPLDEFEAFTALIEKGATCADIARRFGCDLTLVKKRLRLGQVHPRIRQAYRKGKISLETLMVFTIASDQRDQLRVFKEAGSNLHTWNIKRHLTQAKVRADSGLALFVGQQAYEDAGGRIAVDLFSRENGEVYFNDEALLKRLAKEKLDAEAERLQKAEGWSWSVTMVDFDHGFLSDYQLASTIPRKLDAAEKQLITKYEKQLARYAELDEARGLTTEQGRVVEELNHKLDDLKRTYRPSTFAKGGILVSFDHDGQLDVRRGLVKRESPTESKKQAPAKAQASDETVEHKHKGYHREMLGRERLAITQAHLAKDFHLCFDLMLFNLLQVILDTSSTCSLELHGDATLGDSVLEAMTALKPQTPEFIVKEWPKLRRADQYTALCALDRSAKQQLFAWCTARMLTGYDLGNQKPSHIQEYVGQKLQIDMAAHWRPGADNYWERITKDHALAIAGEIFGAKWVQAHRSWKKKDLALVLEKVFAGEPSDGVTPEQVEAARAWLPEGMAYAPTEQGGQPAVSSPTTEELPAAFA